MPLNNLILKESKVVFLSLILLLKAALMVFLIVFANIHLGPDEAQYWTWSQFLDWGYYSKPPGIAWEIWLGTLVFDNTELGVRFGAVVIGFLLPLAVYLLAKSSSLPPKVCFWAAIIMAFTPLGFLSSLFATTDGPFVLFWTLACSEICFALNNKKSPNYLIIGTYIFLGALFKWPIYFLWVIILALVILVPYFRNVQLFIGMGLSLLGLLPTAIWNVFRDWPTFKHVWTIILGGPRLNGTVVHTSRVFVFDFLGAQAALLSPIFFIILLIAFGYLIKNWKEIAPPLLYCGSLPFFLLTGYCIAALFQKMQGNWAVFAYPPAIVFLTWHLFEKMSKRWRYIGLAVSLLLIIPILSLPTIQDKGILSITLPLKYNPLKECLGWNRIPQALNQAGYQPDMDFLFSDRYQMSSLLSFYGPKQKRAYFLNIGQSRKNQFSFWPSMAREKGLNGFFALVTTLPDLKDNQTQVNKTKSLLASYFSQIEITGIYPLYYSNGQPIKSLVILKCIDYNGQLPKDPNLW